MNNTRLIPYPNNPTRPAPATDHTGGRAAPKASPIATLTMPATPPFHAAIETGSAAEILRVKLLSRAQHAHAPAISNGPRTLFHSGRPDHDNSAAPAVIAIMPAKMRRLKFSRNTNHATSAVNTPSRFSRSDAVV